MEEMQNSSSTAATMPAAADVNPAKLFIGNLPWSIGSDELAQLFAQYGNMVDAKVITDKFSGRSKGIGFVEYDSAEAAQAAIEAMHDYEVEGRKLIVNVAKPKTQDDRRGGGFNRNRDRGFGGGNRGFSGHRGGGGFGGNRRSY